MEPEEKKVVFETDTLMAQHNERPEVISGMPRFVIKHSGGLIKDEKQANLVLIGFIVLVVIISLFVLFSGRQSPPQPSPEMLEQIKKMPVYQ